MSRHLKSIIISRLDSVISHYVPSPAHSVAHARGVRYFVAVEGIQALWGSMNTVKESRHYRKHIIVRSAPEHNGLFQLYTYHFPKTWSAACVANRELIKLAQRQAHALEHDYSMAALEYRLRFFKHYFRVFRCGEQPEPGMKRYSRFYQYTYVAIYRELKAARLKAQQKATEISEDISFEQINPRPLYSPEPLPVGRRSIYLLGGVFLRMGTQKSVEHGASYSEGYIRYPNGYRGSSPYYQHG